MNGAILLSLSAAALVFTGCMRSQEPVPTVVLGGGGGATEETNGAMIGRIYNADGTPASYASIFVRPPDFLKDTIRSNEEGRAPDTRTDKNGFFKLDSLGYGSKNVEVQDECGNGLLIHVDLVPEGSVRDPQDTLRPDGAVTGTLAPIPGVAVSGYVQVYGLDKVVHANAAGRFSIRDLPVGDYRLQLVSPVAGWAYQQPMAVSVIANRTLDLGLLAPRKFGSENYADWGHARALFLNTQDAGIADTLVTFPLLVRLNSGNFDFRESNGRDIRFSAADGSPLAYEIERWDSAAAVAEIWVDLDTLWGGSRGHSIDMFWGNPAAADFSRGEAVFKDYAGVWHMQANPTDSGVSTFADASPMKNHGLGDAGSNPRSGIVGMSTAFASGQSIFVPGESSLEPAGRLTLSGWVNTKSLDGNGAEIATFGDTYGLRMNEYGNPQFYIFTDSAWTGNAPSSRSHWNTLSAERTDLNDHLWHYVAAVWDGESMRLYFDAVEVVNRPLAEKPAYVLGNGFRMGRQWSGRSGLDFNGRMDEFRLSGKAFSPGRIKADYENQNPNSGLVEFR
jgi:hypothetical protein